MIPLTLILICSLRLEIIQMGAPLDSRTADSASHSEEDSSNVVVELSTLERPPRVEQANNEHWRWPFAAVEPPLEWRHSTGAESARRRRRRSRQPQQQVAPPELACDFRQRLLDASRRDEICFRFDLSENFRMGANKSLEFGAQRMTGDRSGPLEAAALAERLLEAELHVFKLFPQLAPAAGQSLEPTNRSSGANSFHLKTNLLEVSLYQILPRRRTSGRREQKERDEFPLRLLDIRRIDLNSNGWETFYVKRAVEDWLTEARLNLGLVIKAKSMFDEPIKVGLIRFADAYDHCCRRPEAGAQQLMEADERSANRRRQALLQRKAARDFDTSHQPLLVIYTNAPAR